jgi:TolB-like protein/DNA-binding SARP family transcriptional activator/Tfp pilus assembly protein PilF
MFESRPLGRIRFQFLGSAGLFAGHSNGTVRVSSRKGLALLAYLAMNAGRPVSRAVLADLLWGDRVEAQARQSLRQAILTLRRDLGPTWSSLLSVDDQSLSLAVEADDVDALQFAACTASPDPTHRHRCLDIPWGPFLDKFSVGTEPFDEWVVAERHRLDTIATRVFSDLAKQFDSAGDGERAIVALERLIAIDPADEDRLRRLLILEARHRGPDAALARAKELVARLKREVDAEPEAATLSIIDDIKRRLASPSRLSSPSETRASTDLAAESAAVVGKVESQRATPAPWFSREALLGRPGAGLFATIALIAAGLLWTLYGRPPAGGGHGQPIVVSSSADPWQSPPLPSGRNERGGDPRKGAIPIVVLPFKVYEDTASVRMLADMMTDDLTNVLSRVRYFRVISRQTARAYHAKQIDVADAGRELGVRYALEGSVRTQADKLRVAVELTDTASRTVVWAAHIEREDVNRHVVLDEIVGRLVRELQVGSYPIESARLSDDPDADALSYRGMAALQAAFSNISLEAYDRARVLFVQALERDPQNVMARLGLGSYHVNVAVQRLVADVDSHLNKAREMITAVIREKPHISGAHHQLGIILQGSGQLKEAIDSFERALEINPSSAGSHAHIGFALARMGRPSEGIEHIRYAMRLSPKDPSLAIWLEFAGAAELELDHYQDAIENFRRSTSITPAYPRPWAGLVAAQALAGDVEASRRSLDQLRKLAPNLTADELYQRFARLREQCPRLQEGLRLALADSAATKKTWQSPALPSQAINDPIARERGLVAIAVLPFRSYSENGDGTGLVAEMLTEDLTYLLSRAPVFRVISHQTAASYRGQSVDSAAIGTELGVHYLVEGNISIRGNILRVNVALVDARNRLQVWSGRFERIGEDRHAVQAEIVNGLARELRVSVQAIEGSRTSKDPDVHELIFKGFAAIQAARLKGVEALRPAETYFLQALERDPDAIRAQVGLGAYHAHMAVQLFAPDPAPHLAKAEAILQQVIERHPNVSDAYPQIGLVHVARGHMDKALQSFERAVELNPSNAPSYAQIGRALVSLGQAQAGLQHVLYAMQLSPRDPALGYWLAFAGYALLELTRYDEAIDYLARAHATNPTQPRTALTYIAALAMAGRMSEARLKLEEVQKTHPHLSRERVLKMYSRDGGRTHTKEGIRRVLASENAEHPGPIK